MKASMTAVACLLLARTAAAVKMAAQGRTQVLSSAPCEGNALSADLAAGPYNTLGKSEYDDIIDTTALRDALAASEHWTVGQMWEFSFTANSLRSQDTVYSFSGGGNGFFHVKVPAGAVDARINMSDLVNSAASESSFEYRGREVVTDHDVTITDVCLRPLTCREFKECAPGWGFKEDRDQPGHTTEECCEELMCKDTEQCEPATKYEKSHSWETLVGNTPARCCTPKYCKPDMCNSTTLRPRLGSGILGSTEEECCEIKFCTEYKCTETTTRGRTVSPDYGEKRGSTDVECCSDKPCSYFNCSVSSVWVDKPDRDSILGSTFPECCDALWCEDFTCPTGWVKMNETLPDGGKRRGNSEELCCEHKVCQNHDCNNTKLKLKIGAEHRIGHTNEECCEPKRCEEYTCSSTTKWVHKADIGDTGLAIAGYSDDECCDMKMCSAYACEPVSMWKSMNATVLQTLQGSTHEECCEPRYCENYTCSGDADGDGDSTMYYKKVDTNAFKHQGSSDDACCVPKRCNQYNTDYPSKWTRKKDKSILGSTDAECYDPLFCRFYCCRDSGLLKIPGADYVQGSTDAECCVAGK